MIYVLLILALTLMITGYIFKKGFLAYAATGAWLILCLYISTFGGASFDIYWALVILFGVLAIVSAFEPLWMRESTGEKEEELDPDMEDLRQFAEERRREQERYGFLYGGNRQRRRRPPRRGTSLYR